MRKVLEEGGGALRGVALHLTRRSGRAAGQSVWCVIRCWVLISLAAESTQHPDTQQNPTPNPRRQRQRTMATMWSSLGMAPRATISSHTRRASSASPVAHSRCSTGVYSRSLGGPSLLLLLLLLLLLPSWPAVEWLVGWPVLGQIPQQPKNEDTSKLSRPVPWKPSIMAKASSRRPCPARHRIRMTAAFSSPSSSLKPSLPVNPFAPFTSSYTRSVVSGPPPGASCGWGGRVGGL